MAITTGGILRKMFRPQLHLRHVQHLAKTNEMENSKLDLIAAKRQQFISRLQWVEPAISSPPRQCRPAESGNFLGSIRSLLRKGAASGGASGNQGVLIRSKLSTGERK